MSKKTYAPKIAILVIAVAIVAVGYFFLGSDMMNPISGWSPMPSSSMMVPAKSVAPKPVAGKTTLMSVTPTLGNDVTVTIKGTKFSPTGNTVILRAKDTSIFPTYILKAHNLSSSANGTQIVMTIAAKDFAYGECQVGKAGCDTGTTKFVPGEYKLTVQSNGCTTTACESNGLQFFITTPNQY